MSNGLMGRQELIQLQKTLTRQTQVACGYNCSACKYAPCIQFKIHQHVTPAMHSKGCWQCSHSCKSLARPLLRLCVSERARAPQHTPMFNTCSVKTDSHVQHTPLPNLYTYSHAVSELRKLGTSTFASMCVGKGKSTSTHASRTMRLNINAALECEPYAEVTSLSRPHAFVVCAHCSPLDCRVQIWVLLPALATLHGLLLCKPSFRRCLLTQILQTLTFRVSLSALQTTYARTSSLEIVGRYHQVCDKLDLPANLIIDA